MSDLTPSDIFISYSHDSPQHRHRVLLLADRLRSDGFQVSLDQYENAPPQGWSEWSEQQIATARITLVVCTQGYERFFANRDQGSQGLGARWEAGIIRQHIYDAAGKNERFVPVVLAADDRSHVPQTLRRYTWYDLSTAGGYTELLRRLRSNLFSQSHRAPPPTTLRSSDAFRPDHSAHLVGRESHTAAIVDACLARPLIWLVGTSGVGKTAFLKHGVQPALLARPRTLAPYVDMHLAGWGYGELEALWQGLTDVATEVGADLAPDVRHSPAELASWLRSLHHSGWTLTILFDQFDDYELLNSSHFYKSDGGTLTVLAPNDLCAVNPFWAALAELTRERVVHCLFACRSDNLSLLQSVRFDEPVQKPLPGLDPQGARVLLDALFPQDDLADSVRRDWDAVKTILIEELAGAEGGRILPIQLAVLLRFLRNKPLSLKGYHSHGGIHGIEAIYIREHLQALSGILPQPLARTLLLKMVDTEQLKTRPVSEAELRDMPLPGPDGALRVQQALDYLHDHYIVREGPRTRDGVATWQLHHDYLCRGLLDEHAAATLWKHRLVARQRTARLRRPGLTQWWATLLPPGLQLRLVWERLHRRLRYGDERRLALQSLTRLVGEVVLPLFSLGWLFGVLWLDNKAQREAGEIVASFDSDSTLHAGEVRALTRLVGAGDRVKAEVLSQFLRGATTAKQVTAQADDIMGAVVASSPAGAPRVAAAIYRRCFDSPPEELEILRACAAVASRLPNHRPVSTAFAMALVRHSREAPETLFWASRNVEPRGATAILEALTTMLQRDAVEVEQWSIDLVGDEPIIWTSSGPQLLVGSMCLLLERLDGDAKARYIAGVKARISAEKSPILLASLLTLRACGAPDGDEKEQVRLGKALNDVLRAQALTDLRAAIGLFALVEWRGRGLDQLDLAGEELLRRFAMAASLRNKVAVAKCFADLGPRRSAEQGRRLAEALAAELTRTTPRYWRSIATTIATLLNPDVDLRDSARQTMLRLGVRGDADRFRASAVALAELRVKDARLDAAARALAQRGRALGLRAIAPVACELAELGAFRADPSLGLMTWRALFDEALGRGSVDSKLKCVCRGLAPQQQDRASAVAAATLHDNEPAKVVAIADILDALDRPLAPDAAQRELAAAIESLEHLAPQKNRLLAGTTEWAILERLASELSAEQATQVVELFAQMPRLEGVQGALLDAMAKRLEPPQADRAWQALLSRWEDGSPAERRVLAPALCQAGARLSDQQAHDALTRLSNTDVRDSTECEVALGLVRPETATLLRATVLTWSACIRFRARLEDALVSRLPAACSPRSRTQWSSHAAG